MSVHQPGIPAGGWPRSAEGGDLRGRTLKRARQLLDWLAYLRSGRDPASAGCSRGSSRAGRSSLNGNATDRQTGRQTGCRCVIKDPPRVSPQPALGLQAKTCCKQKEKSLFSKHVVNVVGIGALHVPGIAILKSKDWFSIWHRGVMNEYFQIHFHKPEYFQTHLKIWC